MSAWSIEVLQQAELCQEFDRGCQYRRMEESLHAWYELLDINYQNSLLNEVENIFSVEGEIIEGGRV